MSTRVTINNAKELVNIIKDAYNRDIDVIAEPGTVYDTVSFKRDVDRKVVNVNLHGYENKKYVINSSTFNVMHNMFIFIQGGLASISIVDIGVIIRLPIRIKSYKSPITNDRIIEIEELK